MRKAKRKSTQRDVEKGKQLQVKRVRHVLDTIAFDITIPFDVKKHPLPTIVVRSVNNYAFSRGRDMVHYELQFDPPIAKQIAAQCSVRVTHLPTKQSRIRLAVMPVVGQTDKDARVLREMGNAKKKQRVMRFFVYETHAVHIERGKVACMYFTIHNNQMRGDNPQPVLDLDVNLAMRFFKREFNGDATRYRGLEFFPSDLDVLGPYRVSIVAHEVPQRNPLWFKLRGEVTGSLVPKLLGYYVPTPGTKDAQDWSCRKKEEFTGWKAVAVRFGRLKEDNALLCFLKAFPRRSFEETGYWSHQLHPERWGASPDGICHDSEITVDMLPEETRTAYPDLLDTVSRGVFEIKSSRWNCNFSGSYIPQCMWEMNATKTLWCDLIRYCERSARNAQTGNWERKIECKTIRIFRSKEQEDRLVKFIEQASALYKENKSADFMQLVHSKPYQDMRAYFDEMAEQANVAATVLEIPLDAMERMETYQHRVMGNGNSDDGDNVPHQQQHQGLSLLPLLDQIEEKQLDIFSSYHDHRLDECARDACNQMENYAKFLEHVLDQRSPLN